VESITPEFILLKHNILTKKADN